ncbi:Uncharacterised protein [Citrobacter koseri]|nr:Uncharacterised protein [Citrobacter koseri]
MSIGINASPPSSEKRFAPGNFAPQITLQPFGGGQFVEEAFFLFRAEGGAAGFDTLLNPAFLLGAGDVHILGANRAAVCLFERGNKFAQLHRLFANRKRTYVKAFLEIGLCQIVERGVQIRHVFLLPQSQRIEIRMLVTTETISVDKLQDFDLLRIGVRVGNRRRVT